jgi:hypothetical protein
MKTHYKLNYTINLVGVLDKELSIMLKETQCNDDPDSHGLLDQYEQIHGLGFAVCQTFLTSVHKGKNKSGSFSVGPYHSSGKSYAQITNACANYWKHNDEWERTSLSGQSIGTIEVIESLGIDVWSSYPLSEVFGVLFSSNQEATFAQLLHFLNQWSCEIP